MRYFEHMWQQVIERERVHILHHCQVKFQRRNFLHQRLISKHVVTGSKMNLKLNLETKTGFPYHFL